MRVLLYEYLTGGGLWSDESGDLSGHPLVAEGRAMADALSEDLHRAGTALVRFQDARLPSGWRAPHERVAITSAAHEREALADWARRADGVLLIAPEQGGRLLDRARWVEQQGGRLLSADSAFIALATDKTRTAEMLSGADVRVPEARRLAPGEPVPDGFPWPAVLKPNDGVGSLDTYLVRDHVAARQLRARLPGAARLESYCPGLPASVLAICGTGEPLFLPACRQRMRCDGRFHYLGGATPLAVPHARRARLLARRALAGLPPTCGFVGVDMILGAAADGSRDVVLEVNPRLTTSYVGLRRVAGSNLAAAMLAAARGVRLALRFGRRAVEFDVDGRVVYVGGRCESIRA